MVKKGTILGPRNPITKTGQPRKLPGRKPPPEDLRAGRLVMRVHPDLEEILRARAREKGMTKSAYVESVMIGWAAADPRNPKIDSIGKFVANAQSPAEQRLSNPLRFLERWTKFVQISEQILGLPPKREWLEADPRDYWQPEPDEDEAAHLRRVDDTPYSVEDPENQPHPTTLNPYRKTEG